MRHTLATVATLVLGLGTACADDADAKAVFDKMEAILLKAKSFQTELRTTTVVAVAQFFGIESFLRP